MGVVFFLLSPVILTAYAAAIIFVISVFIFIGICLIAIGITGKVMNNMQLKYTGVEKPISKPSYNIVSVILGILFIVVTTGTVIYIVFSLIL